MNRIDITYEIAEIIYESYEEYYQDHGIVLTKEELMERSKSRINGNGEYDPDIVDDAYDLMMDIYGDDLRRMGYEE